MVTEDRKGMRRLLGGRGKMLVTLLVLVAGIAGVAYTRGQMPAADTPGGAKGRGAGAGRVQPVSVAEVKVADMPIWLPALGTAVPRSLVTVRSRVDGELLKLHFREGETVKPGQPLADIDPRPFRVQLQQAQGQLAKDGALLKNAEIDLERYQDLWARDSIARQQLDTQEALVRQYRGTVEVDKAQLENARLQLDYAHIVAPAGGRIGLRQVDPGNLVRANDAAGLAVIAQLQPINVVFSVPETYLPALQRRLATGAPITVDGWDREQKNRLASGKLLTLDNLVDTATGTIKLKAEFENRDHVFFPNQFVNVRLLLGVRKDATVIPGAAVQRGAKGAFVYVVDGENVVSTVGVLPGASDGDLMAVDGGLVPGSHVVTDGADKLRPGARVEVITAEARAAASEVKPASRGKRRPEGASTEAPPQPAGSVPPAAAR